MKSLALAMLLLLTGGQTAVNRPETIVRELYKYVVRHHPLGIPTGEGRTALQALLSARLLGQLDSAKACERDYYRQHPNPNEKPDSAWLERGLFSGEDEEAGPSEVNIDHVARRNGVYWVYVRFTYRETFQTYGRAPNPNSTWRWRGAAIVRSENSRFVIDDIVLFKRGSSIIDWQLSDSFVGCKGDRWVGYPAAK